MTTQNNQPASAERESGYYWVQHHGGRWVISKWDKIYEVWEIAGKGKMYHDFEFKEIDPTPITRNQSDDEVLGKANEIFVWLLGYTDFPARQEGEGAYYWRTHVRKKLDEAGINLKQI